MGCDKVAQLAVKSLHQLRTKRRRKRPIFTNENLCRDFDKQLLRVTFQIASIEVYHVPEASSTLGLMALSLAGLAVLRRRFLK